MYVNIVIGLLGLTAASTATPEKQQCNRMLDRCALERPGLESKQSLKDDPANVTEIKWNTVIVENNKTSPSGNVSDVDDFMMKGMQNKFQAQHPGIIFMEDEDILKVSSGEAGN